MARVEQNYKEHVNSMDRWGNYLSVEVPYIVFEVVDEEAALNAVRNAIPMGAYNLPLQNITIDTRVNDTTFKVIALYQEDSDTGDYGDDDDAEATVSFTCGNSTKHVLYSMQPQRHLYGGKDAQGAIGWNGKVGKEMEIAGVDVPCAECTEVRTKSMNVGLLTSAYIRRVHSLVGKVNNRRFYGWEKGESMFLGMTYMRSKKAHHVVVQFHFSIRLNETNVEISGHKVGNIEGHEYISAIPIAVSDDGLKSDVTDIYASKPWLYGDFGLLGV